jgi:hypothetical protein
MANVREQVHPKACVVLYNETALPSWQGYEVMDPTCIAKAYLVSLQLDGAPKHDRHILSGTDAAGSHTVGGPAALQLCSTVCRQRAQEVAATDRAACCLRSQRRDHAVYLKH